jgi:hypothetical protein
MQDGPHPGSNPGGSDSGGDNQQPRQWQQSPATGNSQPYPPQQQQGYPPQQQQPYSPQQYSQQPYPQQPYPGAQTQWDGQGSGYPAAPKKKSKRTLIIALAIILVVLIGLGVAGFFLSKGDDKSSAAPTPGNSQSPGASATGSRDDLMERIRQSGPCEMHDQSAVKKYGPVSDVRVVGDLGTCEARAVTTLDGTKVDQSKPITLFDLSLGDLDLDPKKDTPEMVGNHQIFLTHTDRGDGADQADTCVYYLPLPYTGSDVSPISAKLRVRHFLLGQSGTITEWPERCAAAKEYLGHIADKILALAPRQTPPTQPSLSTKAPCLKKDEILQQVTGWSPDKQNEDLYQSPYTCILNFKAADGQGRLQAYITFSKGEAPTEASGDKITIGGLNGIRDRSKNPKAVYYIDTLVYRPADSDDKTSALMITVSLTPYPQTDGVDPKLNDIMDKIAETVVNGAK